MRCGKSAKFRVNFPPPIVHVYVVYSKGIVCMRAILCRRVFSRERILREEREIFNCGLEEWNRWAFFACVSCLFFPEGCCASFDYVKRT